MHYFCKEYGVLPEAGGLNDQHPWVVFGLGKVQKILAIRDKMERDKQESQHEAMLARMKGRRR